MRATYNITDNKLKFWPDERLSQSEYEQATKVYHFVLWHGRKCFAATWTPESEDFIKSFGIEIEADDTPDDLEGRVERFEGYADRAEAQSDYAAGRALDATTTRRAEQAERTAAKSLAEAEYWNRRIAGAIRHAAMKDRPDVIARRIKGLEADLRKHRKTQAQAQLTATMWNVQKFSLEWAIRVANHSPIRSDVVLPDGSKCWSAWSALTDGKITAEDAREQSIKFCLTLFDHEERWALHLEMRLNYERAYLEAVGGKALLEPKARKVTAAPSDGLKKGDLVEFMFGMADRRKLTGKIISLGPCSVRVSLPKEVDQNGYHAKGYQVARVHVKKVDKQDLVPSGAESQEA